MATAQNEKGRGAGTHTTPTTRLDHSALVDATHRELFGSQSRVWFNATAIAARFGKCPADWLAETWTVEYLDTLADALEIDVDELTHNTSDSIRMHSKLAVAFARWLDPEFDLWFDELTTCGGAA